MELRQLRQFEAVGETLNFRRAAERLHMAQPPLSVAIRKLEDELGTELLVREPRGVRLTHAGAAVLLACRKCLSDVERIRAAAQEAAKGESGVLRVGFVGSATYSLMPRLLPGFRARYPGVSLELHEADNIELLSLVGTEQLDVALLRTPPAQPDGLAFQAAESDMLCAVVPANHPLARKKPLTLRDIAEGPFIDYASTKVPGLHAMVMLAFRQAGIEPRQVAQEATQVQTVVSLVAGGLGVALVPSISARHRPKQVVFRAVADMPASASIGIALAYRGDNPSPVLQRFRETAALVTRNASPGRPKR
jgi:DNA-binding transcriptional LysR family regulator